VLTEAWNAAVGWRREIESASEQVIMALSFLSILPYLRQLWNW
jgi:hypothetical protein